MTSTSKSTSNASITSTAILVAMLRRMLRPLVRFLVARQIQYPLLARILKSLYVEVAAEDFPIEGKRLTISRLSLLTGIHRREVKRIQDEPSGAFVATPSAITLGAQIVGRWTGEAPWIDEDGQPRRLPWTSDEAASPSFAQLVNSVSVDIHPRSVLDEWVRIGVASIDPGGAVVLNANAFVPVRGFEDKAHFVARNLRDHLAAACSNLAEHESPFLERSVYYSALPPDAIRELTALAREQGQRALALVNDRARELKRLADAADEAPVAENRRITFGVYSFDAPAGEGHSEDVENAGAEGERIVD
jgi:hypothetical protein